MSIASVTYTEAINALPAEINQNFTDLITFINGSVVHKDGTNAMTGLLTLSANPTSSLHATPKQYVDAALPPTFSSWTVSFASGGTGFVTDYTQNYGKYVRMGNTVFGWFKLTFTAPGETGIQTFTLPVATSARGGATETMPFGACVGVYRLSGSISRAGSVLFHRPALVGVKDVFCAVDGSSDPGNLTVAPASGDTLSAFVRYEVL